MKSIDEVANEVFKIPKGYVITVYLLVTAVLAVGVVLSIRYSDWVILARTGAVLILLAMLCEITGLPERFISRVMTAAESITSPIVLMQVKRLPYLYGVASGASEDQIAEITQKELRRRIKDAKEAFHKALAVKIKKHQFGIASLGTLLWAFADLLNKF